MGHKSQVCLLFVTARLYMSSENKRQRLDQQQKPDCKPQVVALILSK